MKKVSSNSRAPLCSRRRLLLWGGLVSAMVVVSFLNLFETLATFHFSTPPTSSSAIGSIESIGKDLHMFPMGVQQFQQAMHHRVRDEYQGDAEETFGDKVERMAPPVQWPPSKGSKEDCLYTKDYGLLERLRNSSRTFCTASVNGPNTSSLYSFFHVPEAGLSATTLEDFALDIRGAEVAQDIDNLTQDGGAHDPRLKYKKNFAFCNCATLQDGAPNIWKDFFVGGPGGEDANCEAFQNDTLGEELTLKRAVVLVRKDDHNPFFQISAILNAWVMIKTLGWERNTTQLVTLDRAWPAPVDDLRHAVLGPENPIVGGEVFQSRVVRFESAVLTPYEVTGPLMSHLNDNQPCHANAMIAEFKDLSLKSMAVSPRNAKSDPRRCLVTIISRRPYSGRQVQRIWQNEDEILDRMREEYQDAYQFGECAFQALDFVNMTMHDQMRTMVDSDIVIGMHGAGMVNVMWTRPETLIVEIFPRERYRWGYRNLCQYLGCRWHEFRRGRDVRGHTPDPNGMDKYIQYAQWKTFFDPLFRDVIDTLEQKVEGD